jgi:hypothetical protein
MDFERRGAELAERIAAAQRERRRGKVYPPDLRRDIEAYLRDHDEVGRLPFEVAAVDDIGAAFPSPAPGLPWSAPQESRSCSRLGTATSTKTIRESPKAARTPPSRTRQSPAVRHREPNHRCER